MGKLSMMKVSLLAMRRDRKKLTKLLQDMGCIQVAELKLDEQEKKELLPVPDANDVAQLEQDLSRLSFTLEKLQKLAPAKRNLLTEKPVAGENEVLCALKDRADTLKACKTLMRLDAENGNLTSENGRIHAQREALASVEELSLPLEMVHDTAHASVALVSVENRCCEQVLKAAEQIPLMSLQKVGREQESQVFLMAVHRSEPHAWDLLHQYDVKKLSFKETGIPKEEMAACEARMAENNRQIEQNTEQMKAFAAQRPQMELLSDVLNNELARERASEAFAGTQQAFLMTGWIQAERFEEIAKAVAQAFPNAAIWQTEPEEGEEAPVSLRNNKLIQPYEFITDMFSSPGAGDIDPNSMMMPFFVGFFGMMVSDAGYGILLSLLCIVGLKVFKLQGGVASIAKILTLGGVLTLFWGAMFGTWFGFELPPLLINPLQQPVEMLIICFALGGVHLVTGMGIKAYMLIKEGHFLDALGGQIAWFMIFGGALLLLAPALKTVSTVLLIAGLACLLLFSDNTCGFNIFKRLMAGLKSVYGVTGYLSDVLSYARLFAMGLATGVIGSVINTIVGMVWGSVLGCIAGVIIFAGGHIFNLAINALGAYVHASRLQYIEFYGKFYEGGGELFHPLCKTATYVNLK